MRSSRNEFIIGAFTSLAGNGAALLWAAGWLAFGAFGVGLSSGPAGQLAEIWNAFVCLALSFPILVTLIFGVVLIIRRSKWLALGWLAGLAVAAVLGLCLAGSLAAYLTLLSCYPSGPMGPSTCF